MKNFLLTALMAVFIGMSTMPLATAEDPPCIPEGDSTDITQDRPDIDADGMPADAEWKDGDGNPGGWDSDNWSDDDYVGDAESSADGEQATVKIKNVGGKLYGPNGKDVEDSFWEGDCLEIHISWWYRYQVDIQRCVWISANGQVDGDGGGVGGEIGYRRCVTIRVWVTGWVEGPEVQVCPC